MGAHACTESSDRCLGSSCALTVYAWVGQRGKRQTTLTQLKDSDNADILSYVSPDSSSL
jgi:hypothetical protein